MHPIPEELEQLVTWCDDNNLLLNTLKTEEIVPDFRRNKVDTQPLFIERGCVERVPDVKFLGGHIDEHLTWGVHTTAVNQEGCIS